MSTSPNQQILKTYILFLIHNISDKEPELTLMLAKKSLHAVFHDLIRKKLVTETEITDEAGAITKKIEITAFGNGEYSRLKHEYPKIDFNNFDFKKYL